MKARTSKGRTYRKKRVAKPKASVSDTVKKYVKRVVATNIEDKVNIQYANAVSVYCASPTLFFSQYLLPQLSQGLGSGNRIGNEVKITKGIIKGHIFLKPYNLVTNVSMPIMVKMWLVSLNQRNYNTSPLGTADLASFFMITNGSTSFQGNLLDMSFPVNPEVFKVYATKQFLLGAPSTGADYPTSTSGIRATSAQTITPFYFDFGKHCKSKLKFDDTYNSNLCLNKNMHLIITAVSANGDSSASIPCSATYVIESHYEDA